MIKFRATENDTTVIGLGLQAGNIERLLAGQPLAVRLRELGIEADIEVQIAYVPDAKAWLASMKEEGLIDDETVQHGEPPS